MINEELLAASAVVVQSGGLLVVVNIKLAQCLQTLHKIVFGLWYTGWYLQLSKSKPAPAAKFFQQHLRHLKENY
jgi:hypothetical protein